MPLTPAGRAVFGAIAAALVASPVLAEGRADAAPAYGPQLHRHASARALPPESRYRDPRYLPPRRRAPHLGQPVELIHAYLPRTTETPIYNEPPSRFPPR